MRHRHLLNLLNYPTLQKKWQIESKHNPYLANCLPSCRNLASVWSLSKAPAKPLGFPLSLVWLWSARWEITRRKMRFWKWVPTKLSSHQGRWMRARARMQRRRNTRAKERIGAQRIFLPVGVTNSILKSYKWYYHLETGYAQTPFFYSSLVSRSPQPLKKSKY